MTGHKWGNLNWPSGHLSAFEASQYVVQLGSEIRIKLGSKDGKAASFVDQIRLTYTVVPYCLCDEGARVLASLHRLPFCDVPIDDGLHLVAHEEPSLNLPLFGAPLNQQIMRLS